MTLLDKPKAGDLVTFSNGSGATYPSQLTEGKPYEVVAYDPNDDGWPDGTCGTPFIDILDDRGEPFSAFAYRFDKV
jgi:hypothetical protein